MTRILLCGAFGQDNPGDDALLAAFVDALVRDETEVAVTAGRPVDLPGVLTVEPTATGVGRALADADAVVVGGGTIFKTLHPSSGRHPLGLLARTWALQRAAHGRGIPFAMVGVGAGALRSRAATWLTRSVADHADALVLRDEESASVLREAGATGPFRIGADPAWTLFPPVERDRLPRNGVVVALSHLATTEADQLVERLVHVVEPLVARGVAVALQPWQSDHGADTRIAAQLLHRLGHPATVRMVPRPETLADAVHVFARARAVVGLRHHSLVAAAEAGCPFLAIAHEPKLTGLARRLDQPAVPAHASPAVLARSVVELLGRSPARRSLVDREKSSARQAMRLLRVVVNAGAHDELLDGDVLDLTSAGLPW